MVVNVLGISQLLLRFSTILGIILKLSLSILSPKISSAVYKVLLRGETKIKSTSLFLKNSLAYAHF